MAIRVSRTSFPQEPVQRQRPSAIVPVQNIGNPAGAMERPAHQAAQLAQQIWQQERDLEIETKVRELDIQRRELDGQVVGAYTQSFGKDAVDGRGAALQRIKANSKQVLEGLKDNEVRQVFAKQDAALTEASIDRLDSHYRVQNVRWQAETHEARAALQQQSVQRFGYDAATGRLSDSGVKDRSGYVDELTKLGKLRGEDAAATELRIREADTVALGGLVEDLVARGEAGQARAFLAEHQGSIHPAKVADLGRLVQTANTQDRAQRLALELDKKGGTLSEKIATANGLFERNNITADELRMTTSLIEHSESVRVRDFERQGNLALDSAQQWLTENRDKSPALIPPEILHALDNTGRRDDAVRFIEQGKQWITTPKGRADLIRFETSPTLLRDMSDEQVQAMRMDYDDSDFAKVQALRAEADNKATANQTSLLTEAQQLRDFSATMLGLDRKGDLDDADLQQHYALVREIEKRVRVYETTVLGGKRKANQVELQQVMDQAMLDKVRVGSILDQSGGKSWLHGSTEKPVLQMTPDEQKEAWVQVGAERVKMADVPASEQEAITRELLARKRPVTQQAIAEWWIRGGKRGVAK